ncbi:MAG: bifunctional hydroxymethylpyrimidine kinase/phosphomethylpyrimidine kinase [Arenimonas sp.]
MASSTRPTCALTIAGSDSGGGAGIQADLKTFAAHGVHGLSAISVLTAQNTRGVTAIHVPPPAFLAAQLDALFADFRIGAIKIGMLANAAVIRTVAHALDAHPRVPVVLDPVMVASSGATLLDPAALDALREHLLPRATLLTPNIPEAELLLGHAITDGETAEAALVELLALGPGAVLLKGGHLPGRGALIDRFDDGTVFAEFIHARLRVRGHGTGCTLASAVAAHLCLGHSLPRACAEATDYVHGALASSYRPGRAPLAVLDHVYSVRRPGPSGIGNDRGVASTPSRARRTPTR